MLAIDHRALLELLRRTEHLVNVPSPITEEAAAPVVDSRLSDADATAWWRLHDHFLAKVTGPVDDAAPVRPMRTPSCLDISDGNLSVAVHELVMALNEVPARPRARARRLAPPWWAPGVYAQLRCNCPRSRGRIAMFSTCSAWPRSALARREPDAHAPLLYRDGRRTGAPRVDFLLE